MAERVGFEPTLESPLNTLSKRAPSATRPSLQNIIRLNEFNILGGVESGPVCWHDKEQMKSFTFLPPLVYSSALLAASFYFRCLPRDSTPN